MENRWCTACGCLFLPRAQAPRQSYCAEPECQRERRRLWQQTKRRSDPDYLANQLDAQRAWADRNAAYWSAYRAKNPAYVARNRLLQKERNKKRSTLRVAKMDVWPQRIELQPGIYELRPLYPGALAKMGAWTVQLTVIAMPDR